MIPTGQDSLNTRSTLTVGGKTYAYYSLRQGGARRSATSRRLPFSMKVLLENLLRFEDGVTVTRDDLQAMVDWQKERRIDREIQYRPARVLMQDFTGVPAVVDLAAMRDAMTAARRRPAEDQPAGPGPPRHRPQRDGRRVRHAARRSSRMSRSNMQRNIERYEFLKWGAAAFDNFKVVPPGTGICHQVNLEYIARRRLDRPRTRTARWSPIPTLWSAPTATRRWSTASACSAGASAGSRPRRRCSASRSRC